MAHTIRLLCLSVLFYATIRIAVFTRHAALYYLYFASATVTFESFQLIVSAIHPCIVSTVILIKQNSIFLAVQLCLS